jgi:predicted nuclease of predicted toxin-antitoxin system
VRFKTDENLPLEAATILRDAGFDVETIWDETLSGAADEVVAARARAEARVLVTLDLDFANIQAYPPDQHAGIIVLRPKTQDKPTVLAYIRKVIAILQRRSPVGELWIVQRDRIRFRQGS